MYYNMKPTHLSETELFPIYTGKADLQFKELQLCELKCKHGWLIQLISLKNIPK